MTRKVINTTLPTIVGILFAIIFLQIRETALEHLYPENYYDAVFSFQPLFDIEAFFPVYVAAYVAAVAFQFFVVLRVQETYKQGLKIFSLKLWQLTMLSCILFGVGFGLITWYSRAGIEDLLFKIFIGTTLAIIYWCGNLITLFLINKKKYGNWQ